MKKQIIHFGQDIDRKEFYNLIIKITDINSEELSVELRDDLLFNDFMIHYMDEYTIEACFKHRHLEVLHKWQKLMSDRSWNPNLKSPE